MAAIPPICDFGWKAIDAELPGVDGKTHRIFDQAGPNGLVIVFICNHCPYVKAIAERLARDSRALSEHGIGFVAINSNDATTHPEDSFDNMKAFSKKHGLPFHYLHDETQEVARKYDAICTPDFFGFNKDLELQYRGRLDASRNQPGSTDARRELYEAMKLVAETGKGPEEQVASMGCSIKWRGEG
jgi:peroxiredoxin